MKSVQQVLPKTKLGEAIQYCLNQREKLARYTLDGQLNIDNNRAECAIKPFVIGRKNWLFSQTATGANASAVLYSIIETAKANDLNVFEYVMTCLDELSMPEPNIEQLLPWQFAKRYVGLPDGHDQYESNTLLTTFMERYSTKYKNIDQKKTA